MVHNPGIETSILGNFLKNLVRQWNLGQYLILVEFTLCMQIIAVGADDSRIERQGRTNWVDCIMMI